MELSEQQMERMIRENSDASLGGSRREAGPRPRSTRIQLGGRAAAETVDVSSTLSDEHDEDGIAQPASKIKRMPGNGSFA